MPIKERDIVLQGRDGGEDTIDLPITRLANVESGAEVKAEPAQGDYIPIIDSADNEQMKKFPAGWLLEGGLQGPKGDPGEPGPAGPQGEPGPAGTGGKSPYEVAVEAGYTGTEAEFYAALVSLKDGPFLPLGGGRMDNDVGIRLNNGVLTAPPIGYGAAGLSCKDPQGKFARFWIGEPTEGSNAATKKYVDDSIAAIPSGGGGDYLPLAGGDMTGDVDMQNHVITGLPDPVAPADAVNFHSLILNGLSCVPLLVTFYNADTIANATQKHRSVIYGTLKRIAGPNIILEVFGKTETIPFQVNAITVSYPNYASFSSAWSDLYGEIEVTYGGKTGRLCPQENGGAYTMIQVRAASDLFFTFGGKMVCIFGSNRADWSALL